MRARVLAVRAPATHVSCPHVELYSATRLRMTRARISAGIFLRMLAQLPNATSSGVRGIRSETLRGFLPLVGEAPEDVAGVGLAMS